MNRLKSMLENTHVIAVLVILAVMSIIAICVAYPTVATIGVGIVWVGALYFSIHTLVVEIIEMW